MALESRAKPSVDAAKVARRRGSEDECGARPAGGQKNSSRRQEALSLSLSREISGNRAVVGSVETLL